MLTSLSIRRIRFVVSFFLIIILNLVNTLIQAQENTQSEVTNQVWIDFNPSYKISESFDLRGRIGAKAIFPNAWYKIYTRAEVSYKLPRYIFKNVNYNEKVYAGIDYYYIYYTENPNVIEISPYQGYSLFWPNRKRVVIKHNVELGERFQWDVEDWNYSFGLKLSYEASLTFKFHGDIWEYGKGFYLTASAKFWWNLIATTVFNDVVRITPGIGYEINPRWKTAFYIGYNYTKNLTEEEFQTNNIIYRFRVYYTIK